MDLILAHAALLKGMTIPPRERALQPSPIALQRRRRAFAWLAGTVLCAFASPASAVTIDWVPVGNAGNAADPSTSSHYGAVAYNYNIDKYDVTVGQYTEFLNSVAKADPYELYNDNMATDAEIAGIAQSGSPGSYTYSVIGNSANFPVTYVSWGDAVRFANWLQNGQPTGTEDSSTTEEGAYTLNGITNDILLRTVTRNADATIFLPSENEWYKAAYYDPTLNSGAGGYYQYPFSSNTVPTSAPPGSTPDTGNFYGSDYAVAGPPYLTDVGAYTDSASPYGAFDMGGDVWQLTETRTGDNKVMRGGSYSYDSLNSASSWRDSFNPGDESFGVGFRVASVPEPGTAVLAALALVGLAAGALWRSAAPCWTRGTAVEARPTAVAGLTALVCAAQSQRVDDRALVCIAPSSALAGACSQTDACRETLMTVAQPGTPPVAAVSWPDVVSRA